MLGLPAVSVKAPPPMDKVAVPPFTAEVGVKTNVYCVGETATKVPTDPPVAVTSLNTKVDDASDKVIVKVEVCPIFKVELDAVIETEGLT